ncbi:MAG: hypothetical protein ACRDZ7_02280 [Acidimicrobiia bacterium]
MRKGNCVWVALLALVSLVATAGPVSASLVGGGTYVPTARGSGDPDDPGSSSSEAKKKPKEEPCPQELWTVALPVEGLACILLLPKSDPPGEGKDKEGGGGGSLLG